MIQEKDATFQLYKNTNANLFYLFKSLVNCEHSYIFSIQL